MKSPMKTIRFSRAALLLAAVLGALVFSGCSSPQLVRVKPYEREAFAHYTMRGDRDPLAVTMNEHLYFSREAATGGRGVKGSGCGCN